MMDRYAKTVWMKDLLDHLDRCQDEWQSAEGPTEQFLAESMKRDLSQFRRLCQSLRHESLSGLAGAAA